LWNTFDMDWNYIIINLCSIPLSIMPEIRPSSGDYGETRPEIFGSSIPIRANCADQSAALFGEGCFDVGDAKITAGTGCFLDINTGNVPLGSPEGLFPFVAWKIGDTTTYMMEGLASTIGTVVNWARNHLGVFDEEEETSEIASSVPSTEGVYFVPAFKGLDNQDVSARGIITGLTVTTTKAHIVRAMLEGIAHSISDLMRLAEEVAILPNQPIKVDGGLSQNDFLCQFIADLLDKPLDRPKSPCRATAAGLIYLAGLSAGVWPDIEALRAFRTTERIFTPAMGPVCRQVALDGWKNATLRSLSPDKLCKVKKAFKREKLQPAQQQSQQAQNQKKQQGFGAFVSGMLDAVKLAKRMRRGSEQNTSASFIPACPSHEGALEEAKETEAIQAEEASATASVADQEESASSLPSWNSEPLVGVSIPALAKGDPLVSAYYAS